MLHSEIKNTNGMVVLGTIDPPVVSIRILHSRGICAETIRAKES
jgi:hypothetical protein